ncbi:MAG: cell division protein FtsZ [Bacteroidaceae bacterium]|nr:cell division protein FtsZ [Candidatus Minthousia equi]MCQ2246281.1 cell division protein FtsZ [Bacteroidaceae bacterium]MDO4955862.1 cell division protein FtsZ [Bacteroidales bacterium]
MEEFENIDFNFPTNNPSIIKVIGVGGGGGNAVNHMYREGIHDVNFVVCNTDNKALSDSPVPVHLQLGKEGLGAGNRPTVARQAAEESSEEIREMLNDGTKMAFITAGMGGGTGTGAAPVIARIAKEMDILTVGIVTIPFRFEGNKKIDQALDGVEEISKHVDALLVINNERLREIYPELTVMNAFGKADDTLSIAAKSIAEIITMHGVINLDFNDVKTVLKDGGVAIMSSGYGEGENRVTKAIENALHSPLLNNNDIYNSKKVLLSIGFCSENDGDALMMEEMNEVDEFMVKFSNADVETKWGLYADPDLGKQVKVTILATGFSIDSVPGMDAVLANRTKEELEHQAVLEEQEQQREMRRNKFYGTGQAINTYKRRHHIYIFNQEDLDNEDIISMVETTATYRRTKDQLESIKAKSSTAEREENGKPATIVF